MCGIHVINLHIVLKLLKKHVRHYLMTNLLNVADKTREVFEDAVSQCTIHNVIRKIFEEAHDDIFMKQYAKNVNMFYLFYKNEHARTKQFSKDGKIFYHNVEV